MDELLAQFLIEGPELVQRGSDALLDLERRPEDRALMDEAFRAVHTLKGSAGLFDLPAMSAMLHAAEDTLSAIRAGARAPDVAIVDSLLAILSQTERWLDALASAGELPPEAASLGRRLAAQLTAGISDVPAIARPGGPAAMPEWAAELAAIAGSSQLPLVAIRYQPQPGAYFAGDDPAAIIKSVPGLQHLRLDVTPVVNPAAPYDPFECRLVVHALAAAPAAGVRTALRLVLDQTDIVTLEAAVAGDAGGDATAAPDVQTASPTLRVDAASVEALAAMVDELVVARTRLASLVGQAARGGDPRIIAHALAAVHGTLDGLIGQTHRQVMQLRMTPVAPLLRRFPRVVRTLAKALDKDVDVVVNDNGVQADKRVIDGLFEPVTHLLRNAVDHGIEAAPVRAAQDKPRKATIVLTAETAGGRLTLTVKDDGAGIDAGAIRTAVAAKGLRTPEQLAALADDAVIDLVFLPGFSTAAEVTDLSGRGVGMDAVREAVQRLGGSLSISSQPGAGTTVRLDMPLSLTLTKVIVVESGGEAFGLPMDRVLETLRLPAAAITPIRSGQAVNWRNRTVPLLPLSSLVFRERAPVFAGGKVLFVKCGIDVFGITVDDILHRTDVAVRPLHGLLSAVPGLAGTTLMGDGTVLMILDPDGLIT